LGLIRLQSQVVTHNIVDLQNFGVPTWIISNRVKTVFVFTWCSMVMCLCLSYVYFRTFSPKISRFSRSPSETAAMVNRSAMEVSSRIRALRLTDIPPTRFEVSYCQTVTRLLCLCNPRLAPSILRNTSSRLVFSHVPASHGHPSVLNVQRINPVKKTLILFGLSLSIEMASCNHLCRRITPAHAGLASRDALVHRRQWLHNFELCGRKKDLYREVRTMAAQYASYTCFIEQ
jgi:hypothetical protein